MNWDSRLLGCTLVRCRLKSVGSFWWYVSDLFRNYQWNAMKQPELPFMERDIILLIGMGSHLPKKAFQAGSIRATWNIQRTGNDPGISGAAGRIAAFWRELESVLKGRTHPARRADI
jgi:hypothetical protein